ncbi:xanthine dehydrogenase family protein molybdopterin-binding subunit [Flexibacterium corallicola]|uniref:xanthine dehydrogenase family protein molybdopterin-binding subunit n=1 Tax=Flexibacterium corallicola TaxID=3037259 RepID=UPI00286F56AD|nr:xanthine dehydrogenase family protein molybdopterin-binding subunit [Pseudovibrio sp. M1P-2-3]
MTNEPVMKFGIGASSLRVEDPVFLTGQGCFTDDVRKRGALTGYMVRSPFAHADFSISNLSQVKARKGVKLVLTAHDLKGHNRLPFFGFLKQVDGSTIKGSNYEILCSKTLRYVGDAFAFIVAETLENAKDAAESLEVHFEPKRAVVECQIALENNAPVLHPEMGSNSAFKLSKGDREKVEEVFSKSDRIVSIELINNRVVSNFVETRACIGEFSEEDGTYTLTTCSQGGHQLRDTIAKGILKIPSDQLRVITPDVGGGFGTKISCYREYPLVLIAAKKLGVPVRWTGDRTEHFLADTQGRDNVVTARLALDASGKIHGLDVHLLANVGAYQNQYAPFVPSSCLSMVSGLYDIPAVWAEVTGVYTNTTPLDAYRGAGRPEAAYLIERLVAKAALEIGMNPIEFRKLNFIKPDGMPYTTQVGHTYDTGDFAKTLDKALRHSDFAGYLMREEQSLKRGKLRGIGMSCYIEACSFPGREEATIKLDENGGVTLFIGTQSNGQGHHTAYGQLIAEYLGLSLDKIKMVQGDTKLIKNGGGTEGSRSIPIGLTSVKEASVALVRKLKEIGGDRLEVDVEDLELVDGTLRVVGTDRYMSLAALAQTSAEKIEAFGEAVQKQCTYPNGTHICELEVDPETGVTKIERYTVVDDVGVTVNPRLLQGQIHGGVAQAIGQALYEHVIYDDEGQLLTASLLDYHVPRADDLPFFSHNTCNTPSKNNPLGVKGAGEAGTVGAAPAVMNALQYALRKHAGVGHIDMPATPSRVWGAIQAARI